MKSLWSLKRKADNSDNLTISDAAKVYRHFKTLKNNHKNNRYLIIDTWIDLPLEISDDSVEPIGGHPFL